MHLIVSTLGSIVVVECIRHHRSLFDNTLLHVTLTSDSVHYSLWKLVLDIANFSTFFKI